MTVPPGETSGLVELLRVGDTSQEVVVHLSLGGTATVASDYTSTMKHVSGNDWTVTLAAYQNSATIKFTAVDDATEESTETVVLYLDEVVAPITKNYEFVISEDFDITTVSITDNDEFEFPPQEVWIDEASDPLARENGPESDPNNNDAVIVIRRSVATGTLTVNFDLSGSAVGVPTGTTVTRGDDYVYPDEITFADGEDRFEFTISVVNEGPDGLGPTDQIEDPETVEFSLLTGSGYDRVTGATEYEVTILDNDTVWQSDPTTYDPDNLTDISFGAYAMGSTPHAEDYLADEGGEEGAFFIYFQIHLPDTGGTPDWEPEWYLGGTAREDVDYVATITDTAGPYTVEENKGEYWLKRLYKIQIEPIQDGDYEGLETIEIGVEAEGSEFFSEGNHFPGVTIFLEDDDAPTLPVVTIEVPDRVSTERDKSTGGFRLVRDETKLGLPLTVAYEFNSTATPKAALFKYDYTAASPAGSLSVTGTVTFAAGERAVEVKLTPEYDSIAEGLEYARMTILPESAAYTIDVASDFVLIVDEQYKIKILDDLLGIMNAGAACNLTDVLQSVEQTRNSQTLTGTNRDDGGVGYTNGSPLVTSSVLSLPGPGSPMGVSLSWKSVGIDDLGPYGHGWVDSYRPYIVRAGVDSETTVVVANADYGYYFDGDEINGGFVSRMAGRERLTHSPSEKEYRFTTPTGEVTRFHDFDESHADAIKGTFKSRTDAAGNFLEVTDWDEDDRPLEMQQSVTVNGTTVLSSITYEYGTSGGAENHITTATIRRKLNGGSWQTVRSAGFAYYNSSEPHGSPGDLKTITTYDENANAIGTEYYRYYVGGDIGGDVGELKAIFGASAFARLTFDQTDPYAASDATADNYADRWFTWDIDGRVTTVVSSGAGCSLCSAGQGTTTYAYEVNTTNELGYNSWRYKSEVTLADGNIRTAYLNAASQVMLSVLENPNTFQKWATFHAYDDDGRLVLTAYPDAVSGWSESFPDLLGLEEGEYEYIRDDVGTVEVVDWYYSTTASTTAAGGAYGYQKSVRQRRGELSTPARETAVEYLAVEGTGLTRFIPGTTYAIRNANGTGAAATTYAYTWGGPTGVQLLSAVVTLPAVTTAQNGSNAATSATVVFDAFGRPTWSKDQAGFLSYTEYDPGTGAVVKQITDVDTTLVSNEPSGWTTPSGGGLHLTSTYEVDRLGRVTKSTAPNGRIDYAVYKDAAHEVRTYSGWDATYNLPTGPILVSRDDLARGYSESFAMTTTPSVSSGRPTGTESVAGLVSLARSHRNLAGQAVYSDAYFNLSGLTYSTSASLGTVNTHYYRTEQDFTFRGWANRSETPLGTITRTVFDGLGRAVSQWVGTDDTPTSGNWSPTNLTGTDMVMVSEVEYDNGGIGVGNVTKQTVYPGGGTAPRVTQTWYDWRNRPVVVKDGVESTESTSRNRPIYEYEYDNLGRVTASKLYDGDGITPQDMGYGVPTVIYVKANYDLLRALTTTAFDELGRTYLTSTYSVSPTDGEVGVYSLKSKTWYDARGQVVKTSSPGGLVQKMAYDGAGRTTVSYATDGGGDTGYADADDVTGDNVLEQSETAYDASGNVLSQTSRQRFHDETDTGALGTPSSGVNARVSHQAMYYDAGDRLTAAVDHGTNGGSSWTRPSTVQTRGYADDQAPDTTLQGDWRNTYGYSGYGLPNWGSLVSGFGSVQFVGATETTWEAVSTDPAALQVPTSPISRSARAWTATNTFDIDVNFNDGRMHEFGLYFLDWENKGRNLTVTVTDFATGTVLDTDTVTSFVNGEYRFWDLAGHVVFTITDTSSNSGTDAVVSGFFLQNVTADPNPALVTTFDYDSAGRQWKVTDPKGIQSRTEYDALGRTLKTIENYIDGTVGDDNDKTTEYAYNAAGMTSLTAKLTGGGGQTTEWVYGVTTGGGSTIASNDVVGATRWPDPSSGSASSGQQDTVTINALGQTLTSTDRNGTVHTLAYDVIGRITTDTVTTLGTNVDGAVRRVETAYDGQGNPYLVTNYSATTGGSVVNQVQKAFNGLGQLITEYQAHGGAVNTSTTPKVQYAYSEMASGANHSRPVSMTYPNGRVIDFNYGVALDDAISRLSAMKQSTTTLESYDYLGLGTVVKRGHAESGVDLTYIKASGESNGEAGDQYAGLDRFGRVVDQRWRTSSVEKDRYQNRYDRDGNRLYRENMLASSTLSEIYWYDGLNQLKRYDRGQMAGPPNEWTFATRYQTWDYDALGNMEAVNTDGTNQTRTHNKQNEITGVSGATTPVFDANGNMTTDETGKQYVYDAWNRLVTVKNSGGTTIASYEYDGLGRRIQETAGGVTTDLHYSAGWQVLEERVGGAATKSYVWSPVYVDAMVARDRDTDANGSLDERLYVLHDANFNVTGLVTTGGTVVERYTYDPYGVAQVRDGSWTVTTTAYVWQYLHQGGRLSGESGLYAQGFRDYSPTLGRPIQVDPLGLSPDVNPYRWESNSTVNRLDPTGLVDEPGFGESLIPIWGSGRSAIHSFENRQYGWGAFYTVMAVTDVFLVKSIVTAGGKAVCKGVATACSKSAVDETALKTLIVAGEDVAWIARPDGTRIKKVGDLWVKEVNPDAGSLRRWLGRKNIDAQVEGLGRLDDMAPRFLFKGGRLVLEDVGPTLSRADLTRNPLNFFDIWIRGSWRLGTPFNDIKPWNMGKNGLIFDPAINPVHVAADALLIECPASFV